MAGHHASNVAVDLMIDIKFYLLPNAHSSSPGLIWTNGRSERLQVGLRAPARANRWPALQWRPLSG